MHSICLSCYTEDTFVEEAPIQTLIGNSKTDRTSREDVKDGKGRRVISIHKCTRIKSNDCRYRDSEVLLGTTVGRKKISD